MHINHMNDWENLSDEIIVDRVRSVDQSLYAVLMDRYQPKLLRYAVSLTQDEDKAADIVQEAFIKAFINLKSFDSQKKFSSWLYRIVHNEAMNFFAKYPREVKLPEDIDFESEENAEKDFEKKEVQEQLGKCLGQMPILYSEPLTLFYLDDKSYEEISDILRLPMGTVATRLNRAKKIIQKLCQKN